MNRVLLLVVDGCTSRVLGPAVESGELPTLRQLARAGELHLDCLSIFPSITPAATASIVTGCYPAEHGIVGMSWWDRQTGEIAYFGDDVWTILQQGFSQYLRGFLTRLNGERLQAPTIFQIVERHQRRAACINHLIFRGDVPHEATSPRLLRLLPSLGSTLTVYGPSWLCLGDFVSSTGVHHRTDTPGGVFHRFGLDDEGTEAFLRDIPGPDHLPDLTVAYFADYDFESHEHGPEGALDTLRQLDARLARIFDAWGGLERVLHDTCVMLTADHAHSQVKSPDDAGIALKETLSDFQCADPSKGWRRGDDLMLCPNMRSAEIYVGRARTGTLAAICDALLQDTRIDQVIWRDSTDGDSDLRVVTRDRGELRIGSARNGHAVTDEYGGRWEIHGDLSAVDASLDGNLLRYGAYPNAIERIANGVGHPRAGRLWVTAYPGYEFRTPGQKIHPRGGSHGTLHELDSLVPLLLAGRTGTASVRATPRIVDVVPLCAEVLGLPFDVRPGASHAGRGASLSG